MTSNKTIALCIPAYNAAAYLPRLLRSAAAQKIPFDEILVYNDCSTDNTAEVAKAHGARVISGDRNVGCSAGKNTLLRESSSEWIHYHDADDELLPNFTTLAHKWLAQAQMPDVLLFNYEYRDNETRELLGLSEFSSEKLKKDAISYAILKQINPFCGLYKRKKLLDVGGYDLDPEILYNEDVAFHCKLALASFSFDAEKEVSIINYRISNSMSGANKLKCIRAQFEVMKRVANQAGLTHSKEISQKLFEIATQLACSEKYEDMDQALSLAGKLTKKLPNNLSGVFRLLSQALTPQISFRIRETLIRMFKPHLRSIQ